MTDLCEISLHRSGSARYLGLTDSANNTAGKSPPLPPLPFHVTLTYKSLSAPLTPTRYPEHVIIGRSLLITDLLMIRRRLW